MNRFSFIHLLQSIIITVKPFRSLFLLLFETFIERVSLLFILLETPPESIAAAACVLAGCVLRRRQLQRFLPPVERGADCDMRRRRVWERKEERRKKERKKEKEVLRMRRRQHAGLPDEGRKQELTICATNKFNYQQARSLVQCTFLGRYIHLYNIGIVSSKILRHAIPVGPKYISYLA
jgi:hypothetical protein